MALPAPVAAPRPINRIAVSTAHNRISSILDATSTPGAAIGSNPLTETHQAVMPLLAGQTITIPLSGISYYFEFLGTLAGIPNNFAGLRVRAYNAGNVRSDIIHVQGTGLRFGTISFNSLEVTNRDPLNNLQFTIDVGGGIPNNTYDEYIDKRVIIANSPTPGSTFVQNSSTFNVGFKTRVPAWADLLAAGATQVVADGWLGKSRKSIIFANDDAANLLTVFDPAGVILSSIQPATAWTTDTGGAISLHNPSAGNIVCHIGEVYYS